MYICAYLQSLRTPAPRERWSMGLCYRFLFICQKRRTKLNRDISIYVHICRVLRHRINVGHMYMPFGCARTLHICLCTSADPITCAHVYIHCRVHLQTPTLHIHICTSADPITRAHVYIHCRVHLQICTYTANTAQEGSWMRGFDPVYPLLFDVYSYLRTTVLSDCHTFKWKPADIFASSGFQWDEHLQMYLQIHICSVCAHLQMYIYILYLHPLVSSGRVHLQMYIYILCRCRCIFTSSADICSVYLQM